jgi:hypothetical protein
MTAAKTTPTIPCPDCAACPLVRYVPKLGGMVLCPLYPPGVDQEQLARLIRVVRAGERAIAEGAA